MRTLTNTRRLPVLMIISVVAIAAFQYYWLAKAYQREDRTLDMRTNIIFRESVRSVQAYKLKLDRLSDSVRTPLIVHQNSSGKIKIIKPGQKVEGMIDVVMNKLKDSTVGAVVFTQKVADSLRIMHTNLNGRRERMLQFLFDVDSLQDSIRVAELDSAFAKRLADQNIDVPFSIKRVETKEDRRPQFNEVTLGFFNPITFRLKISHKPDFIFRKIAIPILFSIFLVAFTAASFYLLYRNLLRQRRLAYIKNEFISNITHELKTPIATVAVAIEALKNFNANTNPERSKEYLDISSNELQRLSLLVDKVLKLSMFEKKEVDLQYEHLDMKDVVEEVTSSLRLQLEKHHAQLNVTTSGDTSLEADRLHLVSVVFNLLDNAIKYSTDAPTIDVAICGTENKVSLEVRDTGIGIPQEYQSRVFEKFFRVPTGNLHNAKGYGLGLSYVAHVAERHHGTIQVDSVPGDGSRFTITLPRHKV